MTIAKLKQAEKEIAGYRADIISRLMSFAATDMLLFWSGEKGLAQRQEKLWLPILQWAEKKFDTTLKPTKSLTQPAGAETSAQKLQQFMENLTDKQLAAFYLAALNMRSVITAAALVDKQITAEQAYQAGYLEELYQAEKWGLDEEAESRRQERRQELVDIEKFLR